jgi:hypothetical protein
MGDPIFCPVFERLTRFLLLVDRRPHYHQMSKWTSAAPSSAFILKVRLYILLVGVLPDRVVEEHGVLRHDADACAQRGLRDGTHVLPVHQHRALVHVVEPEQ